jgi:hypothetical protein
MRDAMRNATQRSIAGLLVCAAAVGCKTPREAEPPVAEAAQGATPPVSAEVPPTASAEAIAVPERVVSAAPEASAAAPGSAEPPTEPPSEPLPAVEVKNIGMHIGGGPNDRVSKQPIGDSVKPHFDALRTCWKHVAEPAKAGDFGVDLLIPREGGKAEVTNPRTAIKGEGFEACVVGVFEGIDFLKPKTGKTMVSYSVRFTP